MGWIERSRKLRVFLHWRKGKGWHIRLFSFSLASARVWSDWLKLAHVRCDKQVVDPITCHKCFLNPVKVCCSTKSPTLSVFYVSPITSGVIAGWHTSICQHTVHYWQISTQHVSAPEKLQLHHIHSLDQHVLATMTTMSNDLAIKQWISVYQFIARWIKSWNKVANKYSSYHLMQASHRSKTHQGLMSHSARSKSTVDMIKGEGVFEC